MTDSIKYNIVTKDVRPMSAEDRKAIYGFLRAYVKDLEAREYEQSQSGYSDDEINDAFNFKYGV
tara:strand:+ start:1668 stop:1859 length:192 start_codon:yes stop_codon:yes gene_type:complete